MLNQNQVQAAAVIALEYDSFTPTLNEYRAKITDLQKEKAQVWEKRELKQKELFSLLQHWAEAGVALDEEDKRKIILYCKQERPITESLENMVSNCIETVLRTLELRIYQQQQAANARRQSHGERKASKRKRTREIETEIIEQNSEQKVLQAKQSCRRLLGEVYSIVEANIDFISHADIPRWYEEIKTGAPDHAKH